jgi:hypothetical protein
VFYIFKIDGEAYLSFTMLKDRGWTSTAIDRFLGEACLTRSNPIYKSKSAMRLYSLKKIKRKEKTKAFIAWKEKKDKSFEKRSKSIRTANEKKIEQWLEEIRNIEIKLPDIKFSKLKKEALMGSDQTKSGCLHIDKENFDYIYKNYNGKVGIQDAVRELRETINSKIREKYNF